MNKLLSFSLCLLSAACVDRIDIGRTEADSSQIVVDGFISDQPGYYLIKLFRSSSIYDILSKPDPFSAKEVSIIDDLGNRIVLDELALGYYFTDGVYRGQIGRTYTLRIEARDGSIYESTPETIRPAGSIDTLYYEFESFQPPSGPTQSGFRIYMDATGASKNENLVRWKFTGTYKIVAFPELHTVRSGNGQIPAPLGCCKECFVVQPEDKPKVSDGQLVEGGIFRKVEVGYVPITGRTFELKYMVEVEQRSLSRDAYNFWKTIQDQQEGAGSLFQPPLGIPRSNIFRTNGKSSIQGIFYATSIAKKVIFLTRKDVEQFMGVPIPQQYNGSCLDFVGAQVFRPSSWVD